MAIYNLNNPLEVNNARLRLDKMIQDKSIINLTKKRFKRTYQQNRYLHLLLSYFAIQYGETPEYVKQVFF